MTESELQALPDVFWRAARRLRHSSRESLAPFDLSPSHARALSALAKHGVLRLSALSDRLGIAPRSTTEVIDALAQAGLVERRADPADRRVTLAALTAAGTDVVASLREAREQEAELFFGALTPQDRRELLRILNSLLAEPEDASRVHPASPHRAALRSGEAAARRGDAAPRPAAPGDRGAPHGRAARGARNG